MARKRSRGAEDWGDSLKTVLREYAESLLIAIFLALVVRSYVISAYQVPTASMNPVLIEGDFIFGYKLPFGVSLPFAAKKWGGAPPRRGEPVIFKCPLNPTHRCIKRVVGLPGDRVEIRGQRLILNGQVAEYRKAGELTPAGQIPLVEKIGDEMRVILVAAEPKKEQDFGPTIVPPGHFFALNDHRSEGQDSRHWGAIPLPFLEARPLFIWLSFDWGHPDSPSSLPEVRWQRLFNGVD